MAGGSPTSGGGVKVERAGNQKYGFALSLMISLFFMIGFITVLNDVLIPSLKGVFELTNVQAMLIQFCFFGAYFVWSYPSGILIKKVGYKKGLMLALVIMGLGLLLFVVAATVLKYGVFLFALFVVASGLTLLQVAINPYIIALGPEETGASRLNLGGALNSTATFLGPIIGGAFILKHFVETDFANADLLHQAQANAVKGPYIVLALLTVGIAAILYFIKLPVIQTANEEEKTKGSSFEYLHNILGAGAIFFYVGVEVAIGSLLILYLAEESMGAIEEKMASSLLAYYWGSAMIGRFIGSAVSKKFSANKLLSSVTVIAFVLVLFSMMDFTLTSWIDIPVMNLVTEGGFSISFDPVHIPVAAFLLVLVGLFNSVMWPSIFPLGIAKLGKHTSQGSGFMVMMVVGGAIIPLLQGWLSEPNMIGFKWSFVVCLACYAYILFFALKGYKMGKISEDHHVE